jgi:hypothetical protein
MNSRNEVWGRGMTEKWKSEEKEEKEEERSHFRQTGNGT